MVKIVETIYKNGKVPRLQKQTVWKVHEVSSREKVADNFYLIHVGNSNTYCMSLYYQAPM